MYIGYITYGHNIIIYPVELDCCIWKETQTKSNHLRDMQADRRILCRKTLQNKKVPVKIDPDDRTYEGTLYRYNITYRVVALLYAPN